MKHRRIRLYDPLAEKKIQRVNLIQDSLTVDDEVISMDRVARIRLKHTTKLRTWGAALTAIPFFVLYIYKAAIPFIVLLSVEVIVSVDPKLEAKREELKSVYSEIFHTTLPATLDESFTYLLIWILAINLVISPGLALCFKKHLLVNFEDGTTQEFFYRFVFVLAIGRFKSYANKIIRKRRRAEKKAAKAIHKKRS
jgi:hypothetical protein